jgi:hypothetical protein
VHRGCKAPNTHVINQSINQSHHGCIVLNTVTFICGFNPRTYSKVPLQFENVLYVPFKIEMGVACSSGGGGERRVQGCGGET